MAVKKIVSPLISVIIPVYNGEKYLSHCLHSVLSQSYQNVEVIAVNDGSTDNSSQILSEYGDKIRVITQINSGVAAARNAGVTAASGKYIAFLDQDDFYFVNALESLSVTIDESCQPAVMGLTQFHFESKEMCKNWPNVPENGIISIKLLGACLFQKTVFEKFGLLEESLKMADDMEFYQRLNSNDVIIEKVDEVTLNYRVHGENNSLRIMDGREDILKALKFIIDKRRK